MGCFLACFGSSKDKKERHRHSNRVPYGAKDQRRGYNPVEEVVYPNERFTPVQQVVSPTSLISAFQNKSVDEFSAGIHESVQHEASPLKSDNFVSPSSLDSRSREKSADDLSSGATKKVSFNSVVKTHKPVVTCQLLDEVLGRKELGEKAESLAKPSKQNSLSEAGSKPSSLGSYPPNHRYQNCRESDEEEVELDCRESDMDVDIDDSEMEENEYSDEDKLTDKPEISPVVNSIRTKNGAANSGRDAYDQSILNPVENLSQWKALESKGKPPLQPQKENSALDLQEPPAISYSSEPDFNRSASLKSKVAHGEQQTHSVAIDASLSNWLTSPEPVNKTRQGEIAFQNVLPQQTVSQGSYSPKNLEDRPILGALTVEELQLMSRTSSPRRSPTKSPDDMVIIGSVGSYWSREESDKDSGSVSSYKGIPNTTSKYREDKTVNWHSTPFETRLEKALSRSSTQA
ncbi:unnamed protein product [Rhodiola kirilowii]